MDKNRLQQIIDQIRFRANEEELSATEALDLLEEDLEEEFEFQI